MSASIVVYVSNPTTGDLFELPFTTVRFTEELNGGAEAQFSFDYLALKTIADAYNTTVVDMLTSTYREIYIEMDGTKIWYGVISDLNLTRDAQGEYRIEVYAIDFFSLLQKRFTASTRSFSAVDAGTIAWTLIDESQTADAPYSDFGITQGATATSTPRTIDYNFAEIRQAIIDLSNTKATGGFDFDIDTTKKFNVYYPYKGQARANIIFDADNISGFAANKGLVTVLANKIYAVGRGINTDVAYVYVAAPTEYKSAFKVLEEVSSNKQIEDLTLLTDLANRTLALKQSPSFTLTITHNGEFPNLTTYGIGDTVYVTLPELSLTNAGFRVKKRQVEIDGNNTITVAIDLQVF